MNLIKYTFRALLVYGFLTVSIVILSLHYSGLFDYKLYAQNNGIWYPRMKHLVADIDTYFWKQMNMMESLDPISSANLSAMVARSKKKKVTKFSEATESFCHYPENLKGWISRPEKWKTEPPELIDLRKSLHSDSDVLNNFTFAPLDCTPLYTVAIIIPYRARETQLRWFLSHMHKIWRRQQIRYTLYIIEQDGNQLFNRAKLMNVGFAEAMKEHRYDCYVFHDVDLLLESDKCLYWCSKKNSIWSNPRHISTFIDKFNYQIHTYNLGMCSPMTYQNLQIELFGGVTMFTEEQFLNINGFSNLYWGWGAEDDDLFLRTTHKGYKVEHESSHFCSYHMLNHNHEHRNKKNALRYLLLKHAVSRQSMDGLSNLQYSVVSKVRSSLFTSITVDIGRPPRKLREMMKTFADEEETISDFSCLQSLIWMYNKFINI